MATVPLSFIPKPLMVFLGNILPSRICPANVIGTKKFRQILSSIEEIDLIEPLSISPVDRKSGQHLLLDGHLRLLAFRQLGRSEVPCLVSTDEETYTYNNRVNRLSTVQEHFMICRALQRTVSPQRLANALCVDVSQIIKKAKLLNGLCPEAVELLKDRQFSTEVAVVFRRMKPTRQVECAELMVSANNTTVSYARALLVATTPAMLLDGKKGIAVKAASQDQISRMEREMGNLHEEYKSAEQSYGEDTLNLVLARGYICKLVENEQVIRYLRLHYEEVLEEFKNIIQSTSLDP
jgi:hypothetical protein